MKQIELADKEAELAKRRESCVEVRYMKYSDKKKYLRISNTGGVRIFNVRFVEIEKDESAVFTHEKEPVEYLDPGNSYDEIVFLTWGSSKSRVEAVWETEDGQEHRKEYLLTF